MASSSASESKNINSEIKTKDTIVKPIKDIITNLSAIGSTLDESNIKDNFKELKALNDKLTSLLKQVNNKSTITIDDHKYHIKIEDSLIYVNDKPFILNKTYLKQVIGYVGLENVTLGESGSVISFPPRTMTKRVITLVPLFIYICYNLVNKCNENYNFTISQDSNMTETVTIDGMDSFSQFVCSKSESVNGISIKNWVDRINTK